MLGRLSLRARAVALLPLGALAVHDLRYRLAFAGDAGRELERQGHAYMALARPLIGLLCALAAAEVLVRLARAWRLGEPGERPWSRGRVWALATCALVAVYAGQELIEGAVFAGHPAGLEGVLGAGGWLALPLAVTAGGAITLLLAGVRLVAAALAARRRRRGAPHARIASRRLPAPPPVCRRSPLGAAAAGRAPPRPACVPAA